jgi:glucokinase
MPIPAAIGIDAGGTKVEAALVGANGCLMASVRFASRYGAEPREWLAQVTKAVSELLQQAPKARLRGVGVGFAGQIDPATGTVLGSPNLGWRDVPLKAMLQAALSTSVTVVNDVQAATWAEWKMGAGQGLSHLVCIFVGTGIGGGLVLDGRLYTGAAGSAGEIGHTVVDKDGPPCKCGGRGCLEALAGGWTIARRAQEAVRQSPGPGRRLLALTQGDPSMITAATLSEAAHRGDAFAQGLVRQIGEDLGMGVASAVNAFNPELVVLGGGVIEGMPELVEMVQAVVARQGLRSATASLTVTKGKLGNQAGVVGAALLALAAAE